MNKTTDIALTICFLLYFSYYTALGFVFGGLNREESHSPYVALTVIGLILIIISLFVKTRSKFATIRFLGILLAAILIYFDINHSFSYSTLWDLLKSALTYLPTIILLVFAALSILRIRALS